MNYEHSMRNIHVCTNNVVLTGINQRVLQLIYALLVSDLTV